VSRARDEGRELVASRSVRDMETTEPTRVRIGNWNYAGVDLTLGFVIFPALLGVITWAALTGRFAEKTGETDWKLVYGFVGVIAVATILMFYNALTSPVLWIELGNQVAYRTPLGSKSYEWSKVPSLRFEDELSKVKGVPIGQHRILVILLRNKKELRVKVTADQEQAILQLRTHYQGLMPPP
jgi:hypothetical protein